MELPLPKANTDYSEKLKDVVVAGSATPKRETPKDTHNGGSKRRKAQIDQIPEPLPDNDLNKMLFTSGCNSLVRYERNTDGTKAPEQFYSCEYDNVIQIPGSKLSCASVAPNHLVGKPVVLLCFWFPCHIHNSVIFQIIKETYLALREEHKVEFVTVPLIDPKHKSEEEFQEFSSSLPFLTIPYSNREPGLSVAKNTDLSIDAPHINQIIGIIAFDSDGNKANFAHYLIPRLLIHYTTDCYPFTTKHLDSLWQDDGEFTRLKNPYTLKSLLRGYSGTCDLGLTKPDGTPVPHTLSTFMEHRMLIVGFYLCVDGDSMKKLLEVHQECKSNGNNFVIVLIHIPYQRPEDEDLGSFLDRINRKLSSLNITDEDWFVLPYKDGRYGNDRVSLRLWQYFGHFSGDQFTMVGADGEYVDHDAREMISHYGSEAFPFTKALVKESIMAKLGSLTLKDFVPSVKKKWNVGGRKTRNRTIIVVHCYEFQPEALKSALGRLTRWYESIEESPCAYNFEMILVYLDDPTLDTLVAEWPWGVVCCDKDIAASLFKNIKEAGIPYPTNLVALSEGKVTSFCVGDHLSESNVSCGFRYDLLDFEVTEMLNGRHIGMVETFKLN